MKYEYKLAINQKPEKTDIVVEAINKKTRLNKKLTLGISIGIQMGLHMKEDELFKLFQDITCKKN